MQIGRIALSGMYAAQQKFVKSAENVVKAVTPVSEPEQINPEIQPVTPVPEIGEQSTAYIASDIGLIESSVDMMTSAAAYKANLQTFRSWNDTVQSVISDLTA